MIPLAYDCLIYIQRANFVHSIITSSGSIDEKAAFVSVVNHYTILQNNAPLNILSAIENNVKHLHPTVHSSALNKCRGSWYEWIINIMAWNYGIANHSPYLLIQLPNVSSLDVYSLYQVNIYQVIKDYKNELNKEFLTLITSNPDFVLIRKNNKHNYSYIIDITPDTIDFLEKIYLGYLNSCTLDDIVGFVSTKSSFRPDRRLQIINEGSLVKAIFYKMALSLGATNMSYPKYYAVSNDFTAKDKAAFNNVALHSIVSNENIKAVDAVFDTANTNSISNMFRVIFAA